MRTYRGSSHAFRKVFLQLQFNPHRCELAHGIVIRCAVQAYEKLGVSILVSNERIRCCGAPGVSVLFFAGAVIRIKFCFVRFIWILLCTKRGSMCGWSGKCGREVLHRFHLHSALLYATRHARFWETLACFGNVDRLVSEQRATLFSYLSAFQILLSIHGQGFLFA